MGQTSTFAQGFANALNNQSVYSSDATLNEDVLLLTTSDGMADDWFATETTSQEVPFVNAPVSNGIAELAIGLDGDSAAPDPSDAVIAPESNEVSNSNEVSDSGATLSAGSQITELAEFQKRLDELQATTDSLRADLERETSKKPTKLTDPFSVKFRGQIAMDTILVSQGQESREYLGNVKNSVNFRDVRITASGSGHGNMAYSFGVAYQNSIKLLHNYVRFKDTRIGNITVGHHFVESGLESVTYSFDRVYPTLDEGTGVFRLNRRIGVSTQMYNSEKTARAFFGAFCAKSINSVPHYVSYDNPGLILNTRLTATPIFSENELGGAHEVLHLGASYFWLKAGGDTTWDIKEQGLAWMGTNPYLLNGSVNLTNRSYNVSQVEAAWQRDGFAMTTEGFIGSVADGGGNAYGTSMTMRKLWTPGCARIYNRDDARFSTVKMPDEAVFVDYQNREVGRGFGAWESIAKWDWIETDDLEYLPGATYGIVNRMVMGLNWFWNDQAFCSFDWERAFVNTQNDVKEKKGKVTTDTLAIQTTLRF